MTHVYRIYGLVIDSDSELPYLESVKENKCPIDVTLTLKPTPMSRTLPTKWTKKYPTLNDTPEGVEVWSNKKWFRVEYRIALDIVLIFYLSRNGENLIVDKPICISTEDMKSFILGSTLGCVLRLHKKICLHASVLSYKGNAFALIGNKGAGKSTTSAALLNTGAELMADDIAVLNINALNIMAEAGYPAVRLLPNSLERYTANATQFKSVVSFSDKRYVSIPSPNLDWNFNSELTPLKAIYVLCPRTRMVSSCEISLLTDAESLIAIAPHSYTKYMLNESQKRTEFKSLAEVTRRVSIKKITCTEDLSTLPKIATDILADFQNTMH